MAIKRSDLTKVQHSLSFLDNRLREALSIDLLPDSIIEKIKQLKEDVNNFDLSVYQVSRKQLEGDIPSQADVLQLLITESGYNKWKAFNPYMEYDDYEFNPEEFKDTFSIEYDTSKIKEYHFSRNTNNRNDIYGVTITVIPNYFFAVYDTGRACVDSKNLLTLKEFKKELASQF